MKKDNRHAIAQALGIPTPSKRLDKLLNEAAKAGERDAIERLGKLADGG